MKPQGCLWAAAPLLRSRRPRRPSLTPEFAISPDPPRIAFTAAGAGGADLYVKDLTTGRLVRQAETPERETAPDWLPDGSGIVFGRDLSLWVCRADGSRARRLTTDADVWDSSPSVSPDGRQVLFQRATSYRPNPYGVPMWFGFGAFVVEVDGGPVKPIADRRQFSGLSPRFLPSGREFLFFDAGIWRGDLAGNAERIRSGVWADPSPTADLMAFVTDADQPYHYDVYLSRLDGSDVRRLTPDYDRCEHPRFSPDGQWLYFLSGGPSRIPSRSAAIYRIRTDGSALTCVVPKAVLRNPVRYLSRP